MCLTRNPMGFIFKGKRLAAVFFLGKHGTEYLRKKSLLKDHGFESCQSQPESYIFEHGTSCFDWDLSGLFESLFILYCRNVARLLKIRGWLQGAQGGLTGTQN